MSGLETGAKSLEELVGAKGRAVVVVAGLLIVAPLWVLAGTAMGWIQRDRELLNSERQVDQRFIEIALGVLQNNPPSTKEVVTIRNWAARSLQYFSTKAAEDGRIALSDMDVKTLTGTPIAFTKDASFVVSKDQPTAWVLSQGNVSILEGAADTQGQPEINALVELKDADLRISSDEEDEYGINVFGKAAALCGYVLRKEPGENGTFILIAPESLSRCRRMAR